MAGRDIAIVGMAGRFPGAADIDQLWRNLRDGVESLTRFSREQLLAAGVEAALVDDEDYVPVSGALEGADLFAASFFGYTAREALIMDPQQRIFLECCWEALENAGYGDVRRHRSVGVLAGVSLSTYLLNRLIHRPDLLEAVVDIETTIGNDKDFLASRVAYKLDLGGPAVVVQSACSSSLVAVHMARLSLLAEECEMALAGGTSIDVPQRAGHLYKPDGIYSSDGHCRPFDARADGMVGGSGAGVVVLKRLERALDDGDFIHAVIRGSAVNNDGANKVGYSAPSVEAQAEVIAAAQESAGVDSESIGYIEAHGTGTTLGDPIEVAALTQAFATDRRGYCALGSVKSNLGHLNAAAGITGLIKTVLALRHGRIPPSLHYETPNPHIDLDNSPFFVNATLRDWPDGEAPRRAGVSSFGMGGTNAHVVLEQAPERPATETGARPELLVLSARTTAALETGRERLAAALGASSELDLRDVAFTLQSGRQPFPVRTALVAEGIEDAAERLTGSPLTEAAPVTTSSSGLRTAFLFPGQGSQHPGMARDLYDAQATFRREIDRCCELFEPLLGKELRRLLLSEGDERDRERLARTEMAQSTLFTVQYALATVWRTLGIRPDALLGHSVGEYTAACVAGVFGLEAAVSLMAERGRLLQEQPPGAMLAVALPASEIESRLDDALAIAAINEPGVTIVSGPLEVIAELEEELSATSVAARRLETSHAFHSPMMRPAAEALERAVARAEPAAPSIPFVSNVSGTWITADEATDPGYWARHLLSPVRFMEGVGSILERHPDVLLEVGPGRTLSALARRHPRHSGTTRLIATLARSGQGRNGMHCFLEAVGELWAAGGEIDWRALRPGAGGRRVPLPTYPFERRSFWIGATVARATPPVSSAGASSVERLPAERWCHAPSWRRLPVPPPASPPAGPVLVFDRRGRTAAALRRAWGEAAEIVGVRPAARFGATADGFEIDPRQPSDYARLLEALGGSGDPAAGDLLVVHRWAGADGSEGVDRGFDSLLLAARQLGDSGRRIDWVVVTESVHDVLGTEAIEPLQATVLGPCRVIPLEYEGHRCRAVDLEPATSDEDFATQIDLLCREAVFPDEEPTIAYRGGRRWRPAYAPLHLSDPPATPSLPEPTRGLRCLVTGGLSGVGAALAETLGRTWGARLALLSRTALPERDAWASVVRSGDDVRLGRAIRSVLRLEEAGCEVLTLAADVGDHDSLAAALERLRQRFGGLDFVVHAAGLPGGGAISLKSLDDARSVMAPKVEGTTNLWELTRRDEPVAFVLCSSLAAEIGGFGQVDYCAANAFQDAFAAAHRDDESVRVIDWDTWSETGMAVDTEVPDELAGERAERLRLGLRTHEAQELFHRILASRENRVLVSTTPLERRLEPASDRSTEAGGGDRMAGAVAAGETTTGATAPTEAESRPDLSSQYVAPRTEVERRVAELWQRLFGLDRIGLDDDFFELGGHSLLATQLLNRLRKLYPSAVLSLATLFERPTVAGLAAAVTEAPSAAAVDEVAAGGGAHIVLPDRERLAALPESERRERLVAYLTERIDLDPRAPVDIGELAPRICWELRRDLALPVYPHELKAATSLEEVAGAVSAILAGEPSPLTPVASSRDDALPAPATPSRVEEPAGPIVLLLSAPRSGSTLLRLMLAGHPALFCPPELALLSAGTMRRWRERQHDLFARDGLTRSLMELQDLSESEARHRVADMTEKDLPVESVYRELQAALGPRRLVDKSPSYALERDTLLRAEALFDSPRYIFLIRHPVAVIDSLVRHRMEALLSPHPVDDPWRFAEEVWTSSNRNLLELEERVGDRLYRLRYENLVTVPEAALRRLADFLDLPFDEALLEPYAGGRMIDGPGDPDIFQHEGVEAALAEAWRDVELPRPLDPETLELARRLGYEVASATEAPRRTGLDAGEAGDLLERLDDLSDEEVAAALGSLLDDEAESSG